MSYCIRYDKGEVRCNKTESRDKPGRSILKCFVVLLLGFCLIYGYNIRDRLQRVFAPDHLSSAVKKSVSALQSGEPLKDAVDVFCDEIYEGTTVCITED